MVFLRSRKRLAVRVDPTFDFGRQEIEIQTPADVRGGPLQNPTLPGPYEEPTVARVNTSTFLLPPCPSPCPADDERFSRGLVIDRYTYTLYALPTDDLDPDTGMPTGKWVANSESLHRVAPSARRHRVPRNVGSVGDIVRARPGSVPLHRRHPQSERGGRVRRRRPWCRRWSHRQWLPTCRWCRW